MEWSFGKDRMVSVLERHLEPKPKKVKWRYYCCCCCKTDAITTITSPLMPDEDSGLHRDGSLDTSHHPKN
mgnify:CR=1 FL=1|jgi:hypothetical protein